MQGALMYQLPKSNLSWSQIFQRIENNKERLGIIDYSVSQTTLEQVNYYPSLASYPWQALQEEEEKGPGTHCTHMRWGLHSDQSCYHSYSSIDNKWRVYNSIRLPHFFWGPPVHARALCTRPFLLLLLKGLDTRLYPSHTSCYTNTAMIH